MPRAVFLFYLLTFCGLPILSSATPAGAKPRRNDHLARRPSQLAKRGVCVSAVWLCQSRQASWPESDGIVMSRAGSALPFAYPLNGL